MTLPIRSTAVMVAVAAALALAAGCGDGASEDAEAAPEPETSTEAMTTVATVVMDEPRQGEDGNGSATETDADQADGEAAGDDAADEAADPADEAADEPAVPFEDFASATFSDPTTIDNPYLPMAPGTRHVYRGQAQDDEGPVERMIISVVPGLTKEINGVDTVVLWERDFNDGELLESEIAFFAQDDDGNVWHFGQYRETYDENEFVGGRIWLVDLPEGAKAGIIMPADPQPGSRAYSQGYAPPPFNWTDSVTVGDVGAETCAAGDCFTDVLIMEETDEEYPGAFQLKFYAPGVGNVRVGFRGPDPEEEELELVEDVVLTGAELAEAQADALALEERGYMYASTTPIRTLTAN